ncbi:MAG: hypothetical protein K8S94_14230 [Planctomycetia bacterium]|nr:hypothetical protein [Planctomycetia bacterium]
MPRVIVAHRLMRWFVLIVLLSGAPTAARASTVLVNFDSLNATRGPVGGLTLDAYLAGYGITISDVVGAPGPVAANATTNVFLYPDFFAPTSSPNFLQQSAAAAPAGYRLNFAKPLTSLSFTRIAMDPEKSLTGMIAAEWTARAIDSLGNTLGQAGETNYAEYTPVAASTFTFNNPGIVALIVERTTKIVSLTPTTVAMPALDNLVLTTALPEPGGLVGAAVGLAAVATLIRRRQA